MPKKMMGLLCRAMKDALFEFYCVGLGRASAKPGTICFIQRFGDRVNEHIHLHVGPQRRYSLDVSQNVLPLPRRLGIANVGTHRTVRSTTKASIVFRLGLRTSSSWSACSLAASWMASWRQRGWAPRFVTRYCPGAEVVSQ